MKLPFLFCLQLSVWAIFLVSYCQGKDQAYLVHAQKCIDECLSQCYPSCDGQATTAWWPWTSCFDDCQYVCFQHCTKLHQEQGLSLFKLRGRWFFKKVLIFTEPVSAIFSLLGAVLYSYFLWQFLQDVNQCFSENHSKSYPYSFLWTIYYVLFVNTFLGAFVFHTKENYWTERWDYYGVCLAVVWMTYAAAIRTFAVRNRRLQWCVFGLFAIPCAYHLYYLEFVKFDYGRNIKVMAIFFVAHSLLWFLWCFLNYQK